MDLVKTPEKHIDIENFIEPEDPKQSKDPKVYVQSTFFEKINSLPLFGMMNLRCKSEKVRKKYHKLLIQED
ncbi:hypothetical protein ISS37_00300 [candidate division KSB1 bacterium]|nr:hypothetical protein [candidate division KSB1 bacterium]